MAARREGILPLYMRYVTGVPISLGKRTLRLRGNYILILSLIILITVCTCAFVFLNNLPVTVPRSSTTQDIDREAAIKALKDDNSRRNNDLHVNKETLRLNLGDGDHNANEVTEKDREKLETKSDRRQKEEKLNDKKSSEAEEGFEDSKIGIERHRSNIQLQKELFLKIQKDESEKKKLRELAESMKVKLDHKGHPEARGGGEPKDQDIKTKRDKVKEMMLHAWHGYEQYGWGDNEHRPVSKSKFYGSTFGASSLGATIVDSVDTLYIMGLDDEYRKARDWIAQNLTFDVSADLSVFEVNIRFVGGLLSAYALTGDRIFKNKAKDVADRLLPAFNTATGLPFSLVNLKTGTSYNYAWASGGSSILAEVGSLHLEFDYLSTITEDSIYRDKVMKIRTFLKDMKKPDDLYPNFIHPITGDWGQRQVSMGALGDSFYEYLLKEWLMSNRQDTEARSMYDDALKAVLKNMLVTSRGGLTYFAEYNDGTLDHKMDHLACFSAGMLGMGAAGSDNEEHYLKIGEDLANTCHESYVRTATRIGPDAFRFETFSEAKATRPSEKAYFLRPEAVEGWFYLWRLTGKQKYRDWAWDMVQALEKNCRVEGGYSGILNVYDLDSQKDDVQQSYFLAETLKYLFLIFSEDSLLPLSEWVFNTEAHPLPVKKLAQ